MVCAVANKLGRSLCFVNFTPETLNDGSDKTPAFIEIKPGQSCQLLLSLPQALKFDASL